MVTLKTSGLQERVVSKMSFGLWTTVGRGMESRFLFGKPLLENSYCSFRLQCLPGGNTLKNL